MEIKKFNENQINAVENVMLGKKQAQIRFKGIKSFCWARINHILSRPYERGEKVSLADCLYYKTDRALHIIIKDETRPTPKEFITGQEKHVAPYSQVSSVKYYTNTGLSENNKKTA